MNGMSQVEYDLCRLEAVRICTKLMSLLQHYINQSMMHEALSLWADRDDSCYQAVWGCYIGFNSICRCFLRDYGDCRNPENAEFLKGYVCMQGVNSEKLVVAGDLKTARGIWRCQGINACGDAARDKNAVGHGYWTMSRYGVDFIYEEGRWKIWHLLMAPMLHTPYDTPWNICSPFTQFALRETTEDRPPAMPIYNYSLDNCYDYDRPEIPEPYDKFEDVAPGYAYILADREESL